MPSDTPGSGSGNAAETLNSEGTATIRGDGQSPSTPRCAGALAAALVYAVIAACLFWPALRHPTVVIPEFPMIEGDIFTPIVRNDTLLLAWGMARNARTLLHHPERLFDDAQCYPSPKPMALGENMFGLGIQAIPAYLISENPVFIYNFVVFMNPILCALAMFLLVRYYTGGFGPALLAGLLIGFHPKRLYDIAHPNIIDMAWTIFGILLLGKIFDRQRWRDVFLLSFVVLMQLWSSAYALIIAAVLMSVYGVSLLWRHKTRLDLKIVSQLIFLCLVAVAILAYTYSPYIEIRDTWGSLRRDPGSIFYGTPGSFLAGGEFYCGTVLLILAAVGIADRFWPRLGRRRFFDPRLPLLLGAILCWWISVGAFRVPGYGTAPNLFQFIAENILGTYPIRVVLRVNMGVYVAGAFLAGYGLWALMRNSRLLVRFLILCAAIAITITEYFSFSFPLYSPGYPVRFVSRRVEIPEDLHKVLSELEAMGDQGPIADYPINPREAAVLFGPRYVFLNSFHKRPTTSCYNSFWLPISVEVLNYASKLPARSSVEALAALGVKTVLYHGNIDNSWPWSPNWPLMNLPLDSGLERISLSGRFAAYRITLAPKVSHDAGLLGAEADLPRGERALNLDHALEGNLLLKNETKNTFVPAIMERPLRLRARWHKASREEIHEIAAALPVVIPSFGTFEQTIQIPPPSQAGCYELGLLVEGRTSALWKGANFCF